MPEYVDLADIEWEEVGPFAKQKKRVIDDQVVRLLELQPGFEEQAWCSKRHMLHVIEGEIEIAFRDGRRKIVGGDSLVLIGGEGNEHRAVVGSQTTTLFLVDPAL